MTRLTIAGIAGIVGVVEGMHAGIARLPRLRGDGAPQTTSGITGFVYRSIHGVVHLVGQVLDHVLAPIEASLRNQRTTGTRATLLAALNGVLGDTLAATDNPLAITMSLRHRGVALPEERKALAAALPDAGGKLLVLVHGLCLDDRAWTRKGHDHGAALARDLGYTPLYLHYNSGLHVSINGQHFADRLERLLRTWPVPVTELVLVGHSMGGLVIRSACHYAAAADHAWLSRLDAIMFLGTPHQGAPLERMGNWIDRLLGATRYSAPLARVGRIRSAGITDLRHGNVTHEDWSRHGRFEKTHEVRPAIPLPAGVACYAIAATTARRTKNARAPRIGDGLVPVASALGQHRDPRRALAFETSRRWIAYGMNHLDLLSRPEVYERIAGWLTAAPHARP